MGMHDVRGDVAAVSEKQRQAIVEIADGVRVFGRAGCITAPGERT
jgi:hypothetical protein